MSNSSGCPSVPTSQILIDDRNPRIIYSGAWVQDPGRPGMECQATTHGSGLNNGSAMAAFTFNGVGIQVFGTVGVNDGSPVSSYQVDDLPSYTLDFQANGQMNFQYQFYSSPPLDTGPHTLVINVPGKEGSQLFLDYIIYNLSASVTSTVVPSSTTSTTGSTASATLQVDISTTSTSTTSTAAFTSDNRTTSPITSHGSSTSHATSSLTVVSSSSSSTTLSLPAAAASGPSSASHSSPVGAVVGGTVGGIIGLALGIFVTCFVMRKHRRRVAELTNRNKIRSFSLAPSISSALLSARDMPPATSSASAENGFGNIAQKLPPAELGGAADDQAIPSTEPPPDIQPPRRLSLEPIHHTDAGIRLHPESISAADVRIEYPPPYSSLSSQV